jgi:hypothetical protein
MAAAKEFFQVYELLCADGGSQSGTEEWQITTTRFALNSRSAISSGSGIQSEV